MPEGCHSSPQVPVPVEWLRHLADALSGWTRGDFDHPLPAGADAGSLVAELPELQAGLELVRRVLRDTSAELDLARRGAATATTDVIAAVLDGLLLCDPRGLVVEANASAGRLLGVPLSDLPGMHLKTLLPELGDDPTEWPERSEHRISRRDGPRLLEAAISSSDFAGRIRYAVITRDITARNELEAQLHHRTFHDPITDLPNRAHFTSLLARALAQMERSGSAVGLLFVDLDEFKAVNDQLGHEAGDHLLAAVAERLGSLVRAGDVVARLGSDQFAVLLEGASVEGAAPLAGRLLDGMARPFPVLGHELTISAGIGFAAADTAGIEAHELLRRGDVAVHVAKRSGKGTFSTFEPATDAAIRERLQLAVDLRRAAPRGELRLHYQPVFNTSSGDPVALEALLRWEHPTRGLLPPGVFIGLAEETGLIIPLGQWALEEAAAEQARLRPHVAPSTVIPVSVNVSARQFRDPAFLDTVASVVERHRLPPGGIGIEITESLLLEEIDVTIGVLHQLRDLGAVIAIDDFGTGYSSLTYLRRFPLDVLKLDRSFIEHIADEVEARTVVRAVVRLGHDLGLQVVAEGVETEQQLTLLQEWGCDAAQGFFLARPVPVGNLYGLLTPRRRAESR